MKLEKSETWFFAVLNITVRGLNARSEVAEARIQALEEQIQAINEDIAGMLLESIFIWFHYFVRTLIH